MGNVEVRLLNGCCIANDHQHLTQKIIHCCGPDCTKMVYNDEVSTHNLNPHICASTTECATLPQPSISLHPGLGMVSRLPIGGDIRTRWDQRVDSLTMARVGECLVGVQVTGIHFGRDQWSMPAA